MPEIDCNAIELYVFRHAPAGPEFLLLQRHAEDFMGGTWHPVNGGVNPGEKAWQAAEREMYEEAGLDPVRLWQVDTVNPFYIAEFDRVILSICFAAEVSPDARVTLSDEHSDFRWEHVDELPASLLWPGQRRILAEIRAQILLPGPAEPYLRVPIR